MHREQLLAAISYNRAALKVGARIRPLNVRKMEQKRLADTFGKGLLSNLESKSIEPKSLLYSAPEGVRPKRMFFKRSTFDDAKMLDIYQRQLAALILAALIVEEDGMLSVDSSDFPKKSTHSVGVARQHCGILGKTENCQLVFCRLFQHQGT